jgi:phage terminase small subunit
MTKREWGQLGPAMRALPNERWRRFVEALLIEPGGPGAQTNAAIKAGFGGRKRRYVTTIASKMMRDIRIVAALEEEGRKIVRSGGAAASKALVRLVDDPTHKDHARAISMVLARTDPEIQRHDMRVEHRVVDPDVEAADELRAIRALGTPRDKLLELYGANGLARIERLEAKRAETAQVIEGEYKEVPDGQ